MTQLEIKNQLHEEIDQLDTEALMQLRAIISTLKKPSTTSDKRIGGQYKGQFVIKEDFDQLPDDSMAAFTEDWSVDIILDTHIFIWWNDDPSKLSPKARKTIEDKQNSIFISSVVIWEIVVKMMLGKLEASDDPLGISIKQGFIPLPVTGEYAMTLKTLEIITVTHLIAF